MLLTRARGPSAAGLPQNGPPSDSRSKRQHRQSPTLLGLAQPMTHRLGPQLRLSASSASRHYRSPAQNHRAAPGRFHPLAQAKTGAAINPMPPLGSSPLWRNSSVRPHCSSLRSRIFQASSSITNVKGSTGPGSAIPAPVAPRRPLAHLLIHLLALPSARLPWRRASRSSVARGNFTPVNRSITALASATGSLLAAKRPSLAPQANNCPSPPTPKVIRGKTPALAPATPPPRPPDRYHPKAGLITPLMAVGHSAQLAPAYRAHRRGLSAFFCAASSNTPAPNLGSCAESPPPDAPWFDRWPEYSGLSRPVSVPARQQPPRKRFETAVVRNRRSTAVCAHAPFFHLPPKGCSKNEMLTGGLPTM